MAQDVSHSVQKKKDIVAQLIVEAKFIAATTVVNKAVWLKKLMHDLYLKKEESVKVFVDNQTTLAISLNLVFRKDQTF